MDRKSKTFMSYNGFSGVDMRLNSSSGVSIFVQGVAFDKEAKTGCLVPRASLCISDLGGHVFITLVCADADGRVADMSLEGVIFEGDSQNVRPEGHKGTSYRFENDDSILKMDVQRKFTFTKCKEWKLRESSNEV